MFNDRYFLEEATLMERKTTTRREPFFSDVEIETHFDIETGKFHVIEKDSRKLIHTSRYALGEIVAVAQSYEKVRNFYFENDSDDRRTIDMMQYAYDKGWKNKMFVKAEIMPSKIQIKNIRCERLQDISDDDCIREGIWNRTICYPYFYFEERYGKNGIRPYPFKTAREAFTALIDKLNGRGFWDSNPYNVVYEYKKLPDLFQ